jgi:hypothetical protein
MAIQYGFSTTWTDGKPYNNDKLPELTGTGYFAGQYP